MASFSFKFTLLSLVAIFANSWIAIAGDPDILSDFLVPANISASEIDANFFTYHLKSKGNVGADVQIAAATRAEFPALDGQSISISVKLFPPGSAYQPHTHIRSAELFYVTKGNLEIGFVDTTNKLYHQSLGLGDLFLVPKGLVHYQYNSHRRTPATAVVMFASANPGEVLLPEALFASGIIDKILANSFKTDVATIQKIKKGLAPKA